MNWTPSKYQQDIFDFVDSGTGSAVVLAVAGSGKTTTIVEAANRIPEGKLVAFVAFNVSIVAELKSRLQPYHIAITLNSMGARAFYKLRGRNTTLNKNKTRSIVYENLSGEERSMYSQGVIQLVGLAKAHGLVPSGARGVNNALMMDTEQNWADLIDKFGVEFEGKKADPKVGVQLARETLLEGIRYGEEVIDFDDQLYLPIIWGANFNQFDVMFVDECQDVSAIQRAMIKASLVPGGRLIAVGDKAQAIYGFRGADTESVDRIVEEFDAKELPLSISYRCPQLVVQEAKKYVPSIEPSETAPLGVVATLPTMNADTFLSTDAIVCRLNAPTIQMAYSLLRNGKACKVLGRKIGEGLISLIKKMDATTIEQLDEALAVYQARETMRLIAKGREEQAANMNDRVETIRVFMGQLKETNRTIEGLTDAINNLFDDDPKGRLTLCTVHKSKGREWDRVFILDRHLMPLKWARQTWQKQQELNIIYVATTRAKQELYYIDLKGWRDNNEEKQVA